MRIHHAVWFLVLSVLTCTGRTETQSSEETESRSTSVSALRAHPAVGCWALAAAGYRGYARIPALVRLSSKYRVNARGDTLGQALLDEGSRGPGLGYAYWIPI